MSGVSLDASAPPVADKLVITEQQLQLYPGVPRRLNVFVRCEVAGKPCRLYFEEVTPDEENAQQTRYHDYCAAQAQLKATQAALDDEKRKRAEEAANAAKQLSDLTVAHQVLALQVVQTEHNARQAAQSLRDLHTETLADVKQRFDERDAQLHALSVQLDEAHSLIADLHRPATPAPVVEVMPLTLEGRDSLPASIEVSQSANEVQ